MTEDGKPPEFGSLRERLAERLPGDIGELLWTSLRDSLTATKTVWLTCGKCGKRSEAEVRDPVAATRAAAILIEQLEGRPGVAGDGSDGGGTIVALQFVGEHGEFVRSKDGAPLTRDAFEANLGWLLDDDAERQGWARELLAGREG